MHSHVHNASHFCQAVDSFQRVEEESPVVTTFGGIVSI